MGEFICFARGLINKGMVLAYDLVTNGAEWIPVQSTVQELSRAEEMSTLTLYNLVPHSPDADSKRMNRFGENRDTDTVGGKGGGGHHRDNDEDEDAMHSQENPEESANESDWDDQGDNSQ